MVSSLLVEALSSPTDVLHLFHDTYDHGASGDFPNAVSKHFSDIFRTEEAFSEIPPLTPSRSYRDRALVRFRALVQDTSLSPEIYLSKLRYGKCGGWGMTDTAQGDGDDSNFDHSHLRDCVVLWAVSVPGETKWYQSALDGDSSARDQHVEPLRAHKYPIPGDAHYGAQIKLYSNSGNDIPKTTEVLNFVGILCDEPLHVDSDESITVPTLHVLFIREHHLNVFVASPDPFQNQIREELLGWISEEAIGGDRDAAEWILLTCVARVQSRTRSLNPPSLTLSHFPPPTSSSPTPTLFHLLSLILPLRVTLSLSLDLLNSVSFAPESVNEDLHSGYLQLAQGTTVLMTESGIEEGKLIERGVLNVRTVQQIIDTQTIAYKFPFSEFSFPTDLNFIILAEGTKSALFQTDVVFPINSTPTSTVDLYKPKSDIKLPSTDKLEAFRRLILGAKGGNIEVTEMISEHIQEDFVRQRKTDNAMSPEDLKQIITLARLICLTMHESTVTVDGWERAKELNTRRMARFA